MATKRAERKPKPTAQAAAIAIREEVARALDETERILREDPGRNFADPTLPIYVCAAKRKLDEHLRQFETGDKMALLAAIRVCANHDLAMPPWVSNAFIAAYDEVLSCRVGSWDEAFGRPYPKGTHLKSLRQARTKRLAVLLKVRDAANRGESINSELFERIGSEEGIKRTRAEELYAQAKKWLGDLGRPAKKKKLPRLRGNSFS